MKRASLFHQTPLRINYNRPKYLKEIPFLSVYFSQIFPQFLVFFIKKKKKTKLFILPHEPTNQQSKICTTIESLPDQPAEHSRGGERERESKKRCQGRLLDLHMLFNPIITPWQPTFYFLPFFSFFLFSSLVSCVTFCHGANHVSKHRLTAKFWYHFSFFNL